jgi:hypothetical protein
LFPRCYDKKDSIFIQIVWDKRTRELMTEIIKISERYIKKFVKNQNAGKQLGEEKNKFFKN